MTTYGVSPGGVVMSYCSNCGGSLDEGAKFCPACGTPTSGEVPTPPAEASPPPAAQPTASEAQPKKTIGRKTTLGCLTFIVVVVVIVAVAVVSSGHKTTGTAGSPQAGSTPTAASTSPGATGSSVGVIPQDCLVTDDSGDRAVVRLISVTDHAKPKDTSMGSAPKNGEYAVCDISIKVTAGTYDFNPLYFNYQAPDGRTYSTLDGNADLAGFDPSLSSGTLSAGQHTRGFVTFDVPKGKSGADIQLSDTGSNVIFQWNR